jgi:hypothetical protein
MSELGYRDLHLRFHDDGYVESVTRDGRREVTVELLKLSRAIAKDPGLATEVMNRPVEANIQQTFVRLVRGFCEMVEEVAQRPPTLPELTRDLHDLLPWMSHDELMARLRKAAKERRT